VRYELNFTPKPFPARTGVGEYGWPDRETAVGWQSETNRMSPAYVRRVQSALNRVLGLRLKVDGISGVQTRSAIRSFQKRKGLKESGVLDAGTERALFADDGGGKAPDGNGGSPACAAAAHDLEFLADSIKWLNNELSKPTPSTTRVRLLKDLVRVNTEVVIDNLAAYIAAGCCEPSLKTLEAQVSALPWPADPDVQVQRAKLIDAIRKAQEKARKNFEHC
jgi:hypothetical protein